MLKGMNVLLTGGNRGIGNAILELFAKNHANCWCMVRTVNTVFEQQIKDLEEAYGVWIEIVPTELRECDSVKKAFQTIRAEKRQIDILINNAAVNHRAPFLMTSREEMERIYAINFFAPIQLMQLVSKQMIRQRGGCIINICSASGMEHNIGNFSYASSKAALIWATQTASRELAAYHIRVNGVAPGVTDTEINKGNEQVIRSQILERMNIKRVARPEEIAQGVLFLVSEQAAFISGHILKIDGGRF